MSSNKQTYFVDTTLITERSAELPNADFAGGMNAGGSNAPGMGINTGDYDPKESDWPRPVSEVIQNSSVIGGVPSGIFAIDDTFGTNAILSFVQTGGTPVAPDAVITSVSGFDVVNRTDRTIPPNTWVWGVADNPGGLQILTPPDPDPDPEPEPEPEIVAVEEAAVALAEYATTQAVFDVAQLLVTALDPGATQDGFQARLDAIFIPSRLEIMTLVGTDWVDVPKSNYIDAQGFRVRSPGKNIARFLLDRTIDQSEGWACVYVKALFSETGHYSMFSSMGELAAFLFANDQGETGLGAVSIGSRPHLNENGYGSDNDEWIYALDYSGVNPTIYVIDIPTESVVLEHTIVSYTNPVGLMIKDGIRTNNKRDYHFEVNTGADLTNRPFPVDVQAILDTHGADTTGFVLGWGGSGNRAVPAGSTTVAISPLAPAGTIGAQIDFTAVITDADGVDRSSEAIWYNVNGNLAHPHSSPTSTGTGVGDTFSFTPDTYGTYEIEARYTDTYGNLHTTSTQVTVAGSIAESGNTVWDLVNSHGNIADIVGNSVRFGTASPEKLSAVSTNFINPGEFKYVEITALGTVTEPLQLLAGVSSVLNIAPIAEYSTMTAGRDSGAGDHDGAGDIVAGVTPGGSGEFGGLWMDGESFNTSEAGWHNPLDTGFLSAGGVMGIAVDFRGDTPMCYFLHASGGTPDLARSLNMALCTAPCVIVGYVNATLGTAPGSYDMSINGGSNGAFSFDPRAILPGYGVDMTGFVYGMTSAEEQP